MGRTGRDRIVATVCTVLQVLAVQPGSSPDPSAAAGGIATAAGLTAGLSLLARRRAPLLVLAAATIGYVVQAGLSGPSLPAVLIAAAYSAARHGPPLWGAVSAVAAAPAVVSVLALTGEVGIAPLYVVAILLAVLVGALAAAWVARQAATVREAAAEERLRIARDLHDIVGHGVGAITVQAGAGRMALDVNAQEDVRRALTTIEQAGRDVLREVRWLVGLLRDQPERPGLHDIKALADAAGRAGLAVDHQVIGAVTAVPGPTQEAVYRIVQEALTNVVRHSGAGRSVVRVEIGDAVAVEIRDDGEPALAVEEGNGIRGMRERADATGGGLWVGPAEHGPGWVVAATLPITRRHG
ncbi:MAG: sensor histidine kinase [Actinomycetes bacterium]